MSRPQWTLCEAAGWGAEPKNIPQGRPSTGPEQEAAHGLCTHRYTELNPHGAGVCTDPLPHVPCHPHHTHFTHTTAEALEPGTWSQGLHLTPHT